MNKLYTQNPLGHRYVREADLDPFTYWDTRKELLDIAEVMASYVVPGWTSGVTPVNGEYTGPYGHEGEVVCEVHWSRYWYDDYLITIIIRLIIRSGYYYDFDIDWEPVVDIDYYEIDPDAEQIKKVLQEIQEVNGLPDDFVNVSVVMDTYDEIVGVVDGILKKNFKYVHVVG